MFIENGSMEEKKYSREAVIAILENEHEYRRKKEIEKYKSFDIKLINFWLNILFGPKIECSTYTLNDYYIYFNIDGFHFRIAIDQRFNYNFLSRCYIKRKKRSWYGRKWAELHHQNTLLKLIKKGIV